VTFYGATGFYSYNSLITEFDIEFEKNRKDGNENEPGDDANAPYKNEHFFATTLERLRVAEHKIDWEIYNKTVGEL